MRLAVLDYHAQQGRLFPRWTPKLALGFGYPVFSFYAPATYALIEGLHWLGLSHVQGFCLVIIFYALLAGYGMYLLASDFFSSEPQAEILALLAACAYLYAPYFITNLFMRGALAEAGAQALLPWILWSFGRLLAAPQPGRYILPAALSLGGLAVMHNITLLFLPAVLLTIAVSSFGKNIDCSGKLSVP